jgi:hypothetical protein
MVVTRRILAAASAVVLSFVVMVATPLDPLDAATGDTVTVTTVVRPDGSA